MFIEDNEEKKTGTYSQLDIIFQLGEISKVFLRS